MSHTLDLILHFLHKEAFIIIHAKGVSFMEFLNSLFWQKDTEIIQIFEIVVTIKQDYKRTLVQIHTWRNSIQTSKKIRGPPFLDMLNLFERPLHFYRPIKIAQVSLGENWD